ncbi:MAG: tetratricopeptide repeat protein [Deltaproteobacteria bacterium]|nr:tetratricopeptide repeat protein [Deltaproteobacteria bacterium]
MSYINDALKKAQSEKNSRYGNLNGVILAAPAMKKNHPARKWTFGVTSLIVVLAIGSWMLYLYQGKGDVNAGRPVPQAPISQPAPAVAADKSVTETPPLHEKRQDQTVDPAGRAMKHYREALAAQREGRFTEAASLYEKTLVLEPAHIRALNNLGVVYMSQNKNSEAIQVFERAMGIKDDYVDPYYNLACLYSRLNNIDAAFRYLKKAVAVNAEVVDWARSDADLKNLRKTPDFKSLIGKREE